MASRGAAVSAAVDRAPRRPRLRFPDFVVIGAQKAGTSWLHAQLSAHPDLWLPAVKEVHYFDRVHLDEHARERAARRGLAAPPPRNRDRDVAAMAQHRRAMNFSGPVSDEWYGGLFTEAPAGSLCGEVTPAYALLPRQGVEHLLRLAPDVKVLFLVRDPVERAISQIRMGRRTAGRPRWTAVDGAVDPAVLARSTYSSTLRTYGECVGRDRLWVGEFDDIRERPASLLESVCRFLGVAFDPAAFTDLARRVNAAPSVTEEVPPIEPEVVHALEAALAPEYDALADLLPGAARRWASRRMGGGYGQRRRGT